MHIGICDDSSELCMALAASIRRCAPDAGVPRIFSSAEELLEFPKLPELVFLDIELGGMSGMEAAHRIRERAEDTDIVFISGHPEHVFDAFDVDACGYLVKPFDEERLRAVLDKVRVRRLQAEQKEPRIVVSKRGVHTSVLHRDILYAEVFNRSVVLHTASGDIEYYGRLGDLEQQLGTDFFRTHRAYLVNLRYVESYDAHEVRVAGHDVLMSKKNYPAFMTRYLEYIRRSGGSRV